jgi:hypothetical protein
MKTMNLSKTEKRILKTLSSHQYEPDVFNDLSKEELSVSARRLNYERSKTNTDDNIHNFLLSIKIEPGTAIRTI